MCFSTTSVKRLMARIARKMRAVTRALRPNAREADSDWRWALADEFIETDDDIFVAVCTPLVPAEAATAVGDGNDEPNSIWRLKTAMVGQWVSRVRATVGDARKLAGGKIATAKQRMHRRGHDQNAVELMRQEGWALTPLTAAV